MTPFGGPPIAIAKYTDAELMERLGEVRESLNECEQYEAWKPSLLAEREWIRWELDRRDKADQ